jgi:hypothetical protein
MHEARTSERHCFQITSKCAHGISRGANRPQTGRMTRRSGPRKRQRGTIEELPSGSLRVKVYAGYRPARHPLAEPAQRAAGGSRIRPVGTPRAPRSTRPGPHAPRPWPRPIHVHTQILNRPGASGSAPRASCAVIAITTPDPSSTDATTAPSRRDEPTPTTPTSSRACRYPETNPVRARSRT